MSLLFYFYLAAVFATVLLATVAIWAPRRTVPRAAAVILAVTLIPASYVALTEILGRPKPVAHEWWSDHVRDAVLLGTSVDEGRAIYLWVQLDGETRPRYYTLPWRRDGGGEDPGGDRRGDPGPGGGSRSRTSSRAGPGKTSASSTSTSFPRVRPPSSIPRRPPGSSTRAGTPSDAAGRCRLTPDAA